MKPTTLIIMVGLASLVMGTAKADKPRHENDQTQTTAPQSAPPIDDQMERDSDFFNIKKLCIPDIRHWLTCEIVDIQPQKDDTLLMTCRFTNHSNHKITILNHDSIVQIETQDNQYRKIGDPSNVDDLLPRSFFGSDTIWYRNNQYCLMEDLPEWTIKPSASLMVTMTLLKNNLDVDPEADEWEVSLGYKNGQEETVTYVHWPLLELGHAYPDAIYFLFSIPRVRIETGRDVVAYQTGIYATIPAPYRRPFPYAVEAHYKEPPLLTWENVAASSEYNVGEMSTIDRSILPSYINALLMVRDRASADTCASNIRVDVSHYIEVGDVHAELDKLLTEEKLSRTALQYLHYRWSIMQRQIGQVLDELEKVDYYGSDKLKAMSPVIRKDCVSFLATLEKYLQGDEAKKNDDPVK
ncbi:hypothetical protein [Akkermansia glycaniphila]|uniref:Uncharacterized protein n=1 Tax=Akkermansia glycaniphila TaxID=1679444 RepID=A0A1H6M2I7_9BACT|nr:hypothetical protein [Akkermansia glycaniphila]SEH91572.1 Hypothetical protein PYTT_1688 [Akkermansia glycaniphila]